MVVALAGRRIDEIDSDKPSFPINNVLLVKQKILDFFKTSNVETLVCSGANGADLIALEAAGELKIERWMVLPFESEDFRKISVVDRPGNWDEIFDKIFDDIKKENKSFILKLDVEDKLAFKKTNIAILDQADKMAVAKNLKKTAVIVWNGKAKYSDDSTAHFREEAIKRKYNIIEISTIL